MIRYRALDKCLRNRGRNYAIDDLVAACNYALHEFNGGRSEVKKRQVYDDLKFMESSQGWNIPLERLKDGKYTIYRYENASFSIDNSPLNAAQAKHLKQALDLLDQFAGLPQFKWLDELKAGLRSHTLPQGRHAMEFQGNEYLTGAEHLSALLDAILHQRVLQVSYQRFQDEEVRSFTFHTHLLKQYNNRWFAFGLQADRTDITNLALDRILDAKELPATTYRPANVNWKDHFDDVIGVTIPAFAELESVRIRVDAATWPYIRTKPLHHSQKKKAETPTHTEIELRVKVNHELKAALLQYGPGVEVLEPVSLRTTMAEWVEQMAQSYLTQPRANAK